MAELKASLGGCSLVFAFLSSRYDSEAAALALSQAFPGACTLGCTTMGEIGPAGLTSGGASALGLRAGVRCAVRVLDPQHAFVQGAAVIEEMAQELGTTTARLDPGRHLLLLLADGLSMAEERTVASLGFAAQGIRLVGGSAADDFEMVSTRVFLNGRVHTASHLVALLDLELPFQVIHVHHFHPTDRRVVVTRADPARRRVIELDGWPALRVMADIYGVPWERLASEPEALFREPLQLAYVVGDEFFVRSVLGAEGNELMMAGAVDEGAVMRVVRGDALVERTRQGIQRVLAGLENPAGLLLFNCGGRLQEAQRLPEPSRFFDAMAQAPVAGFSTYGEQLDFLHINHTLTGVAIGR